LVESFLKTALFSDIKDYFAGNATLPAFGGAALTNKSEFEVVLLEYWEEAVLIITQLNKKLKKTRISDIL
jgi:hypothetical protein